MKEKLLVLDEEQFILRSLEHLFEDDYEVFATNDAGAALRLAFEHDIAVILCDERMPGVGGHEFLRRAREVSKATRVMMSGVAGRHALTEAVNDGQIFGYIAKPWEPLQLKAQISAAVAHFKLVQEVDQERALLRALMDNIPDSIYFKDCESRFTRVNRAYARSLGAQDSAECIGKTDADYFESEYALRCGLEEERIVTLGRPQVDRIERLKLPRGGLSWVSSTKVPMFHRNGRASGIAGISRDITALKNSEEMVREQNEHNRMILETANGAFVGMDSDGTITAWNPRAEQTFGWTAAEVMGRRLCDTVIAPAYREAHAHGLEHFLATVQGSPLNGAIELIGLHRDGHEFPMEATVWPLRVGGVCSFNAFVRDISERRRTEEDRKKDATRVQLLQSVTVAANRSSNMAHTARTCLNLICAHTGWPVGHLYLRTNNSDQPDPGIWHIEDEDRFGPFRDAMGGCRGAPGTESPGGVAASGKPEWIVNLADEDPLSERTRAAGQAGLRSGFRFPVMAQEKMLAVLEFFSLETAPPDEPFLVMMEHIASQLGQVIRRQRADEDLQRAKQSAEAANRAKSEFLTTMSHEMRTPMNAILGMADLLSQSSLGDEQRNYVRIFQKAGAHLLDLINDILDLSKVESGHFELELAGFDLGALLEKIIEMMISRARDRGLPLTLEIMPGVPLWVIGDPKRLRQILVNLIGNALKFTEEGSVTLRVEPEPGGAAGWLRFSVVDSGIGIAADKTEMIFGRFNQADSSTTRQYGGTGLGLAISKGLVELMGGRIGCISEVGKGSTFFLAAPFEVSGGAETPEFAEPLPIANPLEAARRRSASRILIVDDSEDNVVLMNAYLKDCGFALDYAENGKIAIEKVMSCNPHLALMDMQMPVMDGLEATRAIRAWEAKTHAPPIPILALTAHAAKGEVRKSMEAGCTEHLTKPIKKATLLEAIDRHIGRKIITSPEDIQDSVPNYLAGA